MVPQGMGYVWTALRRMLPPEVTEDIRGMSLTKDDQGAVFDVPAKHMATLRAAMEQEEDSPVSICTSLPELKERNFSMGGGGGGFGGRGGGFGGRGRGFGESTKPAIVFLGVPKSTAFADGVHGAFRLVFVVSGGSGGGRGGGGRSWGNSSGGGRGGGGFRGGRGRGGFNKKF